MKLNERLSALIAGRNLGEAALIYASLGWRVLPIAPGRKKPPLIKDWVRRATTNEDQICEWWNEWPDANVAVGTGVESDVLALDIDKHHADGFASLQLLTDKFGPLSSALVAKTPNNGRHYFFSTSKRIRSGAAVLGAGIDIRAEGGYVLVEPSIVNGGRYAWVK